MKKLIDKLETSTLVKDHSFFFQNFEAKIGWKSPQKK